MYILHVKLTVYYTVSFTCNIHFLKSSYFIFNQFKSNTFSRFFSCWVYIILCGLQLMFSDGNKIHVDNPFAKSRGLSLRTGAQTMLYLSYIAPIFKVYVACYRLALQLYRPSPLVGFLINCHFGNLHYLCR